jgi:hypothetical protein
VYNGRCKIYLRRKTMNKYFLIKEYNEEKHFDEILTIVKNVEPGSWYDEHKIDVSENVFDFITCNGKWAVLSFKDNVLLKVNNVCKEYCNGQYRYNFTDFKNVLDEEQIDCIYHETKKGDWLLVWRKND